MKADKNFKMSTQSKRVLALELDSHRRGQLKRLLIEGELAAQEAKIKSRKSKVEDKE